MQKVPTQHTHLWRRGATYYFRAKVPVDLLQHYAPKREIKFSLKTNDRKEAERLVRQAAVKQDEEFAALRRKRANHASLGTAVLSTPLIDEIANEWAIEILSEDEQDRLAGMDETFFYEQGIEYEHLAVHSRDC